MCMQAVMKRLIYQEQFAFSGQLRFSWTNCMLATLSGGLILLALHIVCVCRNVAAVGRESV